MSPSSPLDSNMGKFIIGELSSSITNSYEYKQAESIAQRYGNQALQNGKDWASQLWNTTKQRVSNNNRSTSTSSTSGSGPLKNRASLKSALSGLKNHFDLDSMLDGQISVFTGCNNFKLTATGSFDIDWMSFLSGDMSALKFSYAQASVEGKIGMSQLNAWVNYSNYSSYSGGAGVTLSGLSAQFGWSVKDNEFAYNSSITKYSQFGDFSMGMSNEGLYIKACYKF